MSRNTDHCNILGVNFPIEIKLMQKYEKKSEQSMFCLKQWFSTFGSWRPTIHNNTQFGDPYIITITQVLASQK